MRHLYLLLAILTLPVLHGCAAVALGAAATGGYLVGEDRRTVGTLAEDQSVEMKTGARIGQAYPNAHVNSTSYNRMTLLTGEVADAATKAEIEKIARSVENVRGVYNELQVAGSSSLSARANDSYVTSKVKARFVDARRFNPVHVKVVTENGTVYLLGIVSRKEANEATELARTTAGVMKVVRVFDYTD